MRPTWSTWIVPGQSRLLSRTHPSCPSPIPPPPQRKVVIYGLNKVLLLQIIWEGTKFIPLTSIFSPCLRPFSRFFTGVCLTCQWRSFGSLGSRSGAALQISPFWYSALEMMLRMSCVSVLMAIPSKGDTGSVINCRP